MTSTPHTDSPRQTCAPVSLGAAAITDSKASAAPSPTPVPAHPRPAHVLWGYFLLTYVCLLLNTHGFLRHVDVSGLWSVAYSESVGLVYTFAYLLPVILIVALLVRLRRIGLSLTALRDREVLTRRIVYVVAILGGVAVQYLVFLDKLVFDVFGFHLNGFVWNLVFTRGGIESMGAGSGATQMAILVALGFAILQTAILYIVWRVERVRGGLLRFCRRTPAMIGACAFVLAALLAQVGYGVTAFQNDAPTLAIARAFPCFVPTTFARIARSLGYESQRTPTLEVDENASGLHYPLNPIHKEPIAHPPNIVWLVSESLRADMLDPQIMPNAWALGERSSRFTHHYSGGNGTRMGMFSMFYGLYGPYWFPFLAECRGPVLMDTLIDLNYQFELRTSAMFSYPEFNKTLFARIPSDELHEGGLKPAWRQDQRHIDSILRFLDQRDESRPFMTFLFFESPHANYSFSKDAIIREPYAKELNYVSMDLDHDIGLIKNRYINACRQVDISIGRILTYLTDHGLLESTIVIITGDHGEEFMEKGRWGHNSEFTEEQTRVPLVLWVPGESPRVVDRMTSHLDIPATLMPLLGVTNPPQDYSLGYDLFGSQSRDFAIIGAWNQVAYVDPKYKATFPTSSLGLFRQTITTADDTPVSDRNAFYSTRQQSVVQVMRELRAFQK